MSTARERLNNKTYSSSKDRGRAEHAREIGGYSVHEFEPSSDDNGNAVYTRCAECGCSPHATHHPI